MPLEGIGIVSNEETGRSLRIALVAGGFSLKNDERGHGETGVDIEATKGDETFHIEVIGFKKHPPQRSREFFEAFFRAISRLNQGATHCVLALPERFKYGLPMRARQYSIAWKRIGGAFPELEIWLVDTRKDTFEVTGWSDWLKR